MGMADPVSGNEGATEGSSDRVHPEAAGVITKTGGRPAADFRHLQDMIGDAYIPPYRLQFVKRLGEGAFAVVDQCMYHAPNLEATPVAVKRLKPEVFKQEDDLQRFLTEAELLHKLRHGCIVDFLGVGLMDTESISLLEKDGKAAQEKVYLVEECMNNGTLKSMLIEQMTKLGKRVYTNKQGLKWCIQMAKGLRHLHDAQPMLIHRDIKLENVLLNKTEDGELTAKIADFGLCAVVDNYGKRMDQIGENRKEKDPSSPQRARTLSMDELCSNLQGSYELSGRTGSLMYMAPEVLRCENYNEKCDIFSLGVIMYELFTRRMLLAYMRCAGEVEEVEKYVKSVAAGSRPVFPRGFPVKLAALVKRCWADNAADRPGADVVAQELESMQEDDEIRIEPRGTLNCLCCSIQ